MLTSSAMLSSVRCISEDLETGKQCECRQYREADNPDPDKPIRCLECLHGRSLHQGSTDDREKKKPSVSSILRGLINSSSGKKASSLELAHKETNNGLKKARASAAPGNKGQDKGKGKKEGGDGLFNVLAVVVNPDGVEYNDDAEVDLINNHVPNKYQVQTLAKQGLAKMDHDNGIEFSNAWSHDEVANALRQLFPLLFEYFDTLDPVLLGSESGEPLILAPWLLCVAVNRRLKLVPELYPNGQHVQFNKGQSRTSFRESRVFIATRMAIPTDIYQDWADTKSLSLGSGSGTRNEPLELSPSPSPSPLYKSRQAHKRLISVTSTDEDEKDIGEPVKKQSKRGPGRKWFRELPEVMTDSIANEIASTSAGPSTWSGASSHQSQQPTEDIESDWIDLTTNEDPYQDLDHPAAAFPSPAVLSFQQPLTPPQPTQQRDPTFSGTSDVDPSLENPWVDGREFHF